MAYPHSTNSSVGPSEALARDVVFDEDFTGPGFSVAETAYDTATGQTATWLKTSTDTNTDGADRAQIHDDFDEGGWLELTVNDNASDVENLQAHGAPFRVREGLDIVGKMRFALSNVSAALFTIGLSAKDTAVYAGVNDFIGFRLDGDGNLDYLVEDDTNETSADTGIDLTDATGAEHAVEVGFWLKYPKGGSPKVKFWAKGGSGTTTSFSSDWLTTNIPDDDTDLVPSIELDNDEAASHSAYVDYVWFAQKRGS